MLSAFQNTSIAHASGPNRGGNASETIITPEAFSNAREEISSWRGYMPTPLVSLKGLASKLSVENIFYKHEGPRFGLGSFKALGGAYAALRVLQREISKTNGHEATIVEIEAGKFADVAARTTVVSATDGNHGRSVSWGAQRLGMPCRIYIHAGVSEERATAMRDLGANVIRIEGDYDESVALAREEAEENGWFVVSDTSWPGYTETPRDVMAGYGVMVHEINEVLEQAPTHVFLQGGVGGLAASVAAALRQHWKLDAPRVVVVEPDLAPCLIASARRGEATAVSIDEETLMAGLSCGEPSQIAWEILAEEAADFLTIPETLVGPAVRLMAHGIDGDTPLQVGESAIAGLAGFLCSASQEELRKMIGIDENSRILLIGSEGVTDRACFEQLMAAA